MNKWGKCLSCLLCISLILVYSLRKISEVKSYVEIAESTRSRFIENLEYNSLSIRALNFCVESVVENFWT